MAYDYDTDILAGLWTGAEDLAEPYAAFLTANPTLTNDVAENRILSTIEALRSHMVNLNSRDEARLLHFCLSTMLEGAGSGGFIFGSTSGNANAVAEGNVVNPLFAATDTIEIWSIDGVSGLAEIANVPVGGTGTLANLIAAINADGDLADASITASRTKDGRLRITQTSAAEVSTITTVDDAPSDALDGTYFDYDTPNNLYRIWISTSGGAAVAPAAGGRTLVQVDITTDDLAADVATALAAAMDALADVNASAAADVVTATNTVIGPVTDAVDTGTTGFAFAVTTQGSLAIGFGIVVDSADADLIVAAKAGIRLDANAIEAGLPANHSGAYFLPKRVEVANRARDRALEVFAGHIRSASQSNVVG